MQDEELGNLNLSKGGDYPNLRYGIRFAAGFGSQIGLSLVRKFDIQEDRIDKKKLLTWNQNQAGTNNLELRILENKLVAYVDGDNNLHGGIQGIEYAKFDGSQTAPVIVEAPPVVNPLTEPIVQQTRPVIELPVRQEETLPETGDTVAILSLIHI